MNRNFDGLTEKFKGDDKMGDRVIPEIEGYTKIQVISFVEMKVRASDVWAKAALLALYDQQTLTEKRRHTSRGRNNCGFGRNDAPILTHLAARLRQNRLSKEDYEVLHIKLPKYARQLICISMDKDGGKALIKHLDLYYKDQKAKVPF
jgi:hypothetical protein